MIKVANCKCSLDDALSVDFLNSNTTGPLIKIAAKALGLSKGKILSAQVLRRSVDARKRNDVHFVLTIAVQLKDGEQERALVAEDKAQFHKEYAPLDIPVCENDDMRPIVVGLGPAGLFAALYLAKAGLRPIVVERGASVEKRQEAVANFNQGADLDLASNIQFGEGGAGTFSDGKLTTGTKNPMGPHVLQWFVESGAPQEILIDAKPHIGSDVLPGVVSDMRNKIIAHGGEVLFETRLTNIDMQDGKLSGVFLEDSQGNVTRVAANSMILACGHSARDTFEMLYGHGLMMEQKPFSMGVRIEHLQRDMDKSQYGCFVDHPALGASEYKMAVHVSKTRSAYTFCMCPGGEVVCAASEEGGIVTNGMSNRARDGKNANAAMLVNVEPSDFGDSHPLAGTWLQRKVEQAAFEASLSAGGRSYRAPAQTVGDFLSGRSGNVSKKVEPSYARGVEWMDIRSVLPTFVCETIEAALPLFDRKLRGFASPDAVMTAPETRSSSPVRICRNRGMQAWLAANEAQAGIGIYPCGEGPGYAGGIMSAAADGLRIAQHLVRSHQLSKQVDCAVKALRDGEAVVFPTDTVYGIGVSVEHAQGPEKIFRIKQRNSQKPVAWLVGSIGDLRKYGKDVPEEVLQLAKRYWPGPLTIIVKAADCVSKDFQGSDGSIGLRMPDNQTALALIRALGCPLATSSANISGKDSPKEIDEVDDSLFENAGAWVADYSRRSGLASTVLDCSGKEPRILREGAISQADVESILHDK